MPAIGQIDPADTANARHCKDIAWDVRIAEVTTLSEEPVFEDADPADYFIFGGVLVWQTVPDSASIVKAQATLDGEPVGRELSITFF